MRIAVVGVGGYYGARLAAGGHDVTFVARRANLEALRRSGLRVESALGDVRLREVTATDRIETVGVVDAALLCVTAYDVESVGPTLTPLVGPDTLVLCTQNGVDAMDRLAPWVPAAGSQVELCISARWRGCDWAAGRVARALGRDSEYLRGGRSRR